MPEYSIVPLPEAPQSATVGQLAPLTSQRLAPLRRLWRAQDSQPGQSRRVLAEYSLGGGVVWAVPIGTQDPDGTVGALYPVEDDWRSVGIFRDRLTSGCMLEAHVMFCHSGLVQRLANNATYVSAGAWGELRVAVTWRNGGATTGPHYFAVQLPGEPLGPYGGLESTRGGADWQNLRERLIESIHPPGYDTDEAVAATFSEWSEVEIDLQVRGGERIVHATVYEVPGRHVQSHTEDGPLTVHGAPASNAPFPGSIRTDAPDTLAYENHRQGTLRMLQVAERQAERLGPRVMHWAHTEHDRSPANAPSLSIAANTNFEDILDTSTSGWSPDHPGWIVAGSTAQLHRLSGGELFLRGVAAVVPVRVVVDAEWVDTPTPSGSQGTVRLQSGEYEWVDVVFDVDELRETRTVYGYLESQVHGDHAAGVLTATAQVGGLELRVWSISVSFGHW